ncbi:hypothetical protein Ahy_A06g029305 [Arachis hypogaea]|uniref:Uncharacterized protein n=1 Tax=Arachis hypogaea TaxID=3818 RepID=A0A445CSW1_ARAHY|nr:hypothetical protein Ahy_A06g029305 [Arachis hypogaea]
MTMTRALAASADHLDESLIPLPSGDAVPTSTSPRLFHPPHSNVTINEKEAMERPNDEAGLLSNVLGLLGADYGKFSICEDNWRKITSKDKVYNDCIKQIFHYDEDSGGGIKRTIVKSLGRSWKETSNTLYHQYYGSRKTIEQNLEERLPGIDKEYWRWFLEYRNKLDIRRNVGKNVVNLSKQVYTHTGGSKSLARRKEEEERIVEIEQQDESTRSTLQPEFASTRNKVQIKETRGVLLELQAEVSTKKLKRKAVEDEVVAEKKKRQAIESMPRKAKYTKVTSVAPPLAPPASSPSADDDWLIPPPPINGGVSAAAPLRPFRPSRTEPRPEPQTANGVQVTELCNEDVDPEANEVDSFEEHIDRMFATSDVEKHKGRQTIEFWDVELIDSDGIVKQVKMNVREAMERSLNGSKVILRFNDKLQAVGDGAGMLSDILGVLGSDYSKFPICEKSWAKVQAKDTGGPGNRKCAELSGPKARWEAATDIAARMNSLDEHDRN